MTEANSENGLWDRPGFKVAADALVDEAAKIEALLASTADVLAPRHRVRVQRIVWHFRCAAALLQGQVGPDDVASRVALKFAGGLWEALKESQGSETKAVHYLLASAFFSLRFGMSLEDLSSECQEAGERRAFGIREV